MQRMRKPISVLFAFGCLCAAGCGGKSPSHEPLTANIAGQVPPVAEEDGRLTTLPQLTANSLDRGSIFVPNENFQPHPEVLLQTTLGPIKVRLHADKAPITVTNFLEHYVANGFYTGTVFHHVDVGFMVIAGGYTADGTAKPASTPIPNEAYNGLKNRRGTLAMARETEYADSATCQFFINLGDNPELDYSESSDGVSFGYCVFGEVVEGMEVIDRIASVPVASKGYFPKMPSDPVEISEVTRLR